MEEGDPMTTGTGSGDAVDQFDSFGFESGEVTHEVLGAVGDVVEGGPSTVEKSPDAGVWAQGLQKFNGPHERDAHALGFKDLRVGTALARQEFVETATLVDGVDGDRDMVDRALR